MIIVYFNAANSEDLKKFYCDEARLFHRDGESGDRIVFEENKDIRLAFVTAVEKRDHYMCSIELESCQEIYTRLEKIKFSKAGSGIYDDFFGKYLETPISSQFTLIDPAGNKILFFSRRNYS